MLLLELEIVDRILGDKVINGEHFLCDFEAGLQVEQVISDIELCLSNVPVPLKFKQFMEGLLEGSEAISKQHVHFQLDRVETLE